MSKRWRVVVPGCLIGSGLSVFLGLMAIGKSGLGISARNPLLGLLVCFDPLGGPLAEPLAYVDFDPLRMVIATFVLLALIALHPLRPGIATGILSGLAIVVWFVWGLGMTYDGV